MNASVLWFGVAALGVWRITHLLAIEDGPAGVLARLREAASAGFWASLFGCFHCLSLWVALPFALLLGAQAVECVLLWLGLSGAACLLQRIGATEPALPPAMYYEGDDKEEHDVLLRRSAPGNDPPGQ